MADSDTQGRKLLHCGIPANDAREPTATAAGGTATRNERMTDVVVV